MRQVSTRHRLARRRAPRTPAARRRAQADRDGAGSANVRRRHLPLAELSPGKTQTIDTLDCAAGLISRPDDLITHIDELMDRLGGLNFVTGPFSVPGASPGDVLRVTILDIEPAPATGTGFIALAPGFGSLVHGGTGVQAPLGPVTTICPVDRQTVAIPLESATVQVPARPSSAPSASRPNESAESTRASPSASMSSRIGTPPSRDCPCSLTTRP